MQGQRGAIGSLTESLAFENASASNEPSEYMRNPPTNGLSDYISPPNSTQIYPNSTNQETQNTNIWSIGEAGSSSLSKPHHYEPPASITASRNLASNGHHNIIVNPSTFIGLKPETYLGSTANGSSSSNLFAPVSETSDFDGRRLPCKRKAVEQSSSGIGSSNPYQMPEGNTSAWRDTIEANSAPSDEIIPRLGLAIEGVNPIVENTHRNVRSRVNVSGQQDSLSSNNVNNNGQFHFSSSSHESQPVLRLPALRRNLQANRSSPRANRSSNISSSNNVVVLDEHQSRTNISDHPIFVQPSEPRTDVNWSLNGGGSSAARAAGSSSGGSNQHRGSPHYPSRRLSEILHRSLLLSSNNSESSIFSRIPPPVGRSASSSSQDSGIPIEGHHQSRSSLLLDRRLDGAFGFPYLSRSAATGTEGRGRLVSELRNVLDLMRRGEGLRFEDVMILDPSVFYGVADMHDRHRDMRLDIDNMSYEELLALEERIGNVNTGLTEETISNRLKQKKYTIATGDAAEPCCVCQEEYKNEDDLGALECGHEFHANCIKQWLTQKNLCPVCKSTAFATRK